MRPACSKYRLAIRKWLVGCEQRTPGLEDLRSSVLTVQWLLISLIPRPPPFFTTPRFRVYGGGLGTRLASQHAVLNLPTPLPSFSSFNFLFSLLSLLPCSLPPSLLPPSFLPSSISVSIPPSLSHPSPFPSFSFLKKA